MPTRKCVVRGCGNTSYYKPSNPGKSIKSFFQFPYDGDQVSMWKKLSGLSLCHVIDREISSICSDHFDDCVVITKKKSRILKTGALPSLKLPGQARESSNSNEPEKCAKVPHDDPPKHLPSSDAQDGRPNSLGDSPGPSSSKDCPQDTGLFVCEESFATLEDSPSFGSSQNSKLNETGGSSDPNYIPESVQPSSESFTEGDSPKGNKPDLTFGSPAHKVPYEQRCVVSVSKLEDLFKTCHECLAPAVVETTHLGMGCRIRATCTAKRHIRQWDSETTFQKFHMTNLMLAAAILFTGLTPTKVLRFLSLIGIRTMTIRNFFYIQKNVLIPAIRQVFNREQLALFATIGVAGVNLAGDQRADTPGHNAKYGTYSMMDILRNWILYIEQIQKNDEGVSSSNAMELAGLKKCLSGLMSKGIKVLSLTTDRHIGVGAHMNKNVENVSHYLDIWHVAKSIRKQLSNLSKRKGFEIVGKWIDTIIRHLYHCGQSCDGNAEMQFAKWESIVNHIAGIHNGHSKLFPKCEHKDVKPTKWMKKGTVQHDEVKKILLNTRLGSAIRKLSPLGQTYGLESFHSVINHFAPKSTHFTYDSMYARTLIAALHYNENSHRPQAVTKAGNQVFKVQKTKSRKGVYVLQGVKAAATYDYVSKLFSESLDVILNGANVQPLEVHLPLTVTEDQPSVSAMIKNKITRFNAALAKEDAEK